MFNGIQILERKEPFPEGIRALAGIPTSILGDVTVRVIGTIGIFPVNRSAVVTCGNAFTVKVRSGDNLLLHRALRMLKEGDVLVVDGEGDVSRALFGEIMMTVAKSKGAIAAVFDAAIRDVEAFEEHQFPCWAKGVNLRGPYKDGPGSINVPISIGGMIVNPGDIIVGDSDGVVAIPPNIAIEVARMGSAKVEQERTTIQSIKNGSYDDSWIDKVLNQKGS